MLKETGKVMGKREKMYRAGGSIGPRHEGRNAQDLNCRDKGSQGWYFKQKWEVSPLRSCHPRHTWEL